MHGNLCIIQQNIEWYKSNSTITLLISQQIHKKSFSVIRNKHNSSKQLSGSWTTSFFHTLRPLTESPSIHMHANTGEWKCMQIWCIWSFLHTKAAQKINLALTKALTWFALREHSDFGLLHFFSGQCKINITPHFYSNTVTLYMYSYKSYTF